MQKPEREPEGCCGEEGRERKGRGGERMGEEPRSQLWFCCEPAGLGLSGTWLGPRGKVLREKVLLPPQQLRWRRKQEEAGRWRQGPGGGRGPWEGENMSYPERLGHWGGPPALSGAPVILIPHSQYTRGPAGLWSEGLGMWVEGCPALRERDKLPVSLVGGLRAQRSKDSHSMG